MFAYHPQHDTFAQIYNDPTCIATYRRKLYVREDTFKCMIWIIKSRRPLPCGVSRMMCIFMRARAMRGNRVSMSISCGYFINMWKWKRIPEAAEWHVPAQTNSLLFFSHIYTLCVYITVIVKRRYTTPKPPSNGLYTRQYAHYSCASRNTNWLIAKRNGVMVCMWCVSFFCVRDMKLPRSPADDYLHEHTSIHLPLDRISRTRMDLFARLKRRVPRTRAFYIFLARLAAMCQAEPPTKFSLWLRGLVTGRFCLPAERRKALAGDSPHVWWQFI